MGATAQPVAPPDAAGVAPPVEGGPLRPGWVGPPAEEEAAAAAVAVGVLPMERKESGVTAAAEE